MNCSLGKIIDKPVYWALLTYWSCRGTRYLPNLKTYLELKAIANKYQKPIPIIRAVAKWLRCNDIKAIVKNYYDLILIKPKDKNGINYWINQVLQKHSIPCDVIYYITKAAICDYPNNPHTKNIVNLLLHFYYLYENKIKQQRNNTAQEPTPQNTQTSANYTTNYKPTPANIPIDIPSTNNRIPPVTTSTPHSNEENKNTMLILGGLAILALTFLMNRE